MAKDKCPECIQRVPGWLVQFADLMSLLLVFFVLLLSMAVMDKVKVEEYFHIMKRSMGFLDSTTDVREQTDKYSNKQSEDSGGEDDGSESESDSAAEEISDVMNEMNQAANEESQQMTLEKGKNEFTLDIPSTLMFKQDEYELTDAEAKKFIAKIARVIRTMPQVFNIEIIGHTDRSSYTSDKIPRDTWDISVLRSISVVKELIKNKIDPAQLKVSGHAAYRPKSDVAAENRRVEMRFYSQDDQRDILEEENFFDRLEE